MSTHLRHFIFYIFSFFIVSISVNNGFSQSRYWVNGSGNWNDTNHWSESSGGIPGANIPTKEINVVFDDNSFTSADQTVFIKENVTCKDFYWNIENIQPSLKSKSFLFKTNTKAEIQVYGSLKVNENINNQFFGDIVLKSEEESDINIKSDLNSDVLFASEKGEWDLKSDLKTSGDISVLEGKVSLNANIIETNAFISSGNLPRSINISDSKIITNSINFEQSQNLNLQSDNYKVEIKNKISEKSVKSGDIPIIVYKAGAKATFNIDSVTVDSTSCYNGNDGSITVYVSGGTSPYYYTLAKRTSPVTWADTLSGSNSGPSYTFVGLRQNGYKISVEDTGPTGGGFAVDSVYHPDKLIADSIGVIQGLTCSYSTDAILEAYVSGGNPAYSYQWLKYNTGTGLWDIITTDDPANKQLIGASQGWYTVNVTDQNGCGDLGYVSTEIFFLEGGYGYDNYIPSTINITGVSSTNTCNGFSTGNITVSATGGTAPLKYAIVRLSDSDSTIEVSGVFTGLQADTYKVYAIDANDCFKKYDTDVTIDAWDNPTASISPVDPTICPDATVDLNGNPTIIEPGASIQSHAWTGDIANLSPTNTVDPTYTGATNGVFNLTYTVTDDNGCQGSDVVTITVEDVTPPTAVCQDITVQLDGTGNVSIAGADVDGGSTDNCSTPGALSFSVVPNSFTCANIGINPVTLTVTDEEGNSSNCGANVTVEDVTPPVISGCPLDINQGTDAGTCDAIVNWVEPTADDNCDGAMAFTTRSHAPGSTFTAGITTVTYTFTDSEGNTSTCNFDVTITDDDAPVVVGCPADINQGTDATGCDAVVNWVEPTANDNCNGAMTYTTRSHAPGSTFAAGTTTVTYTFTDIEGNTSICSFDVTITDDDAPTISGCPADINQGTDATGCDAVVTWTEPTANDNCDGAMTYTTRSHAPGSTFATGITTVTYTFTDTEGNTSNCTFDITIADDDAPVISGCPADINQGTDVGTCDAVVTWIEPTANDNCDGAMAFTTRSHAPGSTFAAGITTVSYTFTDGSGNTSTCNFDVTITDDDAPVIAGCPLDINQGTDAGTCDAVVNWIEPTANDNCDGAMTYTTRSHAPGSTFAAGTTTVTYTFTDGFGNTSVCNFDVIITDDENPVIAGCPADINQGTDVTGCDAVVTWVEPTATDNCDGAMAFTTRSHAPGSTFTAGITTVTYTFTDTEGNTSVCNFDVTITDDDAPVVSGCPADINQGTDATGCDAVVTWTEPTANDNCDGAMTYTTRSHAPGSTFATGTTVVTYTFTDGSGNTSNCIFNVTIADDDAPVIVGCPVDVNQGTDAGTCDAVVNWVEPTATDNCDGAMTYSTRSHAPGSTFTAGTTTVTYTFTDLGGNTSTCNFDVIITDDEDPIIAGCPVDINQGTDAGTCDAVVTWVEPTANDNCDGAMTYTTRTHAPGSAFAAGTTTVTYTFTDTEGNTASCNFDVIITDDEAPVVSGCPADINQGTDVTGCDAVVTWTEPTANDNCDGAMTYTTRSHAPGSTFATGTTTVTYTFTDSEGYTSNCSFDITITDDDAPSLTCPANVSVEEDGTCSAVVNGLAPIASDNCGITVQTWTMAGATINAGVGDVSGQTFNVGITTVTYHVEDAEGNFADCSFDVEIFDVVNGGEIDADQTVCYNTTPNPFISVTPASVCGGFTYQWQMKSGVGSWGDILGATNETYTELNPLTEVTLYNRKAISDLGFGTEYSDTITISIQPEPIAFAGVDTTLCFDTPYYLQDADTVHSDGVTWEILTGNGDITVADLTKIDPVYTPDISDGGTVVELVLHASGKGLCGESTDTVRINYLSELLVSIGKPAPFYIDSMSTHIDVYFKIEDHRFLGDLALYLVSPLDSVVELKSFCSLGIPAPVTDLTAKFYNDPYDTSTVYTSNINECNPTSGNYKFVGDWKKKLHGQDPTNGAWRVRVADNRSITGSDGYLREATVTFSDTNRVGLFESILLADSAINMDINESPGGGIVVNTDRVLPITGLTTSCYGVCDATAVATASGGQAPYTFYEWSQFKDFSFDYASGVNADTVDLCAGKFYVRVTDSHGCTAIDSILVSEPPEIVITKDTVIHNRCYGDAEGKVVLEFTGGVGTLRYSYDGMTYYNSGDTVFNLAADTYTFTIEDANCSITRDIEVKEPSELVIDNIDITPITCHDADDGKIEIFASGGTQGIATPYFYSVDSADTWVDTRLFENLEDKKYITVVQDSLGCVTYGDTIFLNNPDTISIDSVKVVPTTCAGTGNDGQIIIYATGGVVGAGGLEYSLNGTDYQFDNTFTGLPVCDTTVFVRDNCGTKQLDTLVTVTGPIPIEIDSVVVDDVNTCYGESTGQITVYAKGGTENFIYSIDGVDNSPPESNVFSGYPAGTYTVRVTDDGGCTSPDSTAVIDQPTPVVIDSYTVIHTSECNSPQSVGEISLSASGGSGSGYSYKLVRESDNVTTNNPTVGLFTGLQVDNYYFLAADGKGCESAQVDTAIILYPAMDIYVNGIDIGCNGETNGSASVEFTTEGTAPYNYSWTNSAGVSVGSSQLINGLSAGWYYVTVTDDNESNNPSVPFDNCIDNDSIEIIEPNPFTIVLNSKDVYCIDTDCKAIDAASANGYINPGVSGGTGDIDYNWVGPNGFSSQDDFITNLKAGTYFLTVTDDRGCDSIVDVTINPNDDYDITELSVEFLDTSVCWNQEATFRAEFDGYSDTIFYQIGEYINGGWSYRPETFVEVSTSPMLVGDYLSGDANYRYIRVTNQYCYQDTLSAVVNIDYIPSFQLDIIDELDGNAEDDTIYLKGARTGTIGANVNDLTGITFEWFESGVAITGSDVQILNISPDSSAYYTVRASTDECVDSSRIYLEFIPAITPNEAFTPNGDGINDLWRIKFIEKFQNNVVTIYNRWGTKVFEQKGYTNEDESKMWDGRAKNGKDLPSGTYYYVIILNEAGFQPITGPITIIR